VVASIPANCPLFQNAELKAAWEGMVKANNNLKDADKALIFATAEAEAARTAEDGAIVHWDACHMVYIAQAAKFSVSAEDMTTTLHLTLGERTSHVFAAPLKVETLFDPVAATIDVTVTPAPGRPFSRVEITRSPLGSMPWVQAPGIGLTHSLTGYGPGVWLVRAAKRAGFCLKASASRSATRVLTVVLWSGVTKIVAVVSAVGLGGGSPPRRRRIDRLVHSQALRQGGGRERPRRHHSTT
jgi:hypothetical protein